MENLSSIQIILIGIIFVWSGFVRSGLGFGGAVLSLPFLLLIVNDPLIFLPLIAVQLLISSGWIIWKSHLRHREESRGNPVESYIDWGYLKKGLKIMIIPKMIGVVGLLTLSPKLMSMIILIIVSAYSIGYIINRPIQHKSKWIDVGMLSLGGYISGTSLTSAPLVIPVFAQYVPKQKLRDTLFVLWFILTAIKLVSFIIAGVDLQLEHQLWLLPCAMVGHVLGERLHQRIVAAETPTFFRWLGISLLVVSVVGLWRTLLGP
jgi:uncharacterized membrane protein YfcA